MRPTPADPAAWNAHLAEGNATQARKRVAADVLVRDGAGSFLLVRPTYKPGWDLPGGMVEANEPPQVAAVRELREELGLTVRLRGPLVVDWVPPHGPWDDQLAFVFDGGVVGPGTVATLRPQDEELSEVRFVAAGTAVSMLGERMARRFSAAVARLGSGHPVYLHDGRADWAG
ncbi:NUDIX hydrolase [Streptomyces sp. NPDC005892]|uniref:NUDIX hydrolase n=1 Tax=Streptomyces sp. NPDC005892 TaxID=3155593 RepID=UPI0033C70F44